MLRTSEILIYIFLTLLCFGSMIYLIFMSDSNLLFFLPIIIYGILITIIARNKKILTFVEKDFKELGYELISERPLRSSESEIEIKPAILTSGNVPINSFKNKYKRIFTAKSKKGKLVELNSVITENYDGTLKIEITEKKNCNQN